MLLLLLLVMVVLLLLLLLLLVMVVLLLRSWRQRLCKCRCLFNAADVATDSPPAAVSILRPAAASPVRVLCRCGVRLLYGSLLVGRCSPCRRTGMG